MSQEDASVQSQKRAQERLEQLIKLMGFECSIESSVGPDEEILLDIELPDAGRLIGRCASVLDAIQYLLNRMLHKEDENVFHCTVDIERYRERRKERLLEEAVEAREHVIRHNDPYRFISLKALDRKLIHRALEKYDDVETYSEQADEYGMKCLVVCSVGNRINAELRT